MEDEAVGVAGGDDGRAENHHRHGGGVAEHVAPVGQADEGAGVVQR